MNTIVANSGTGRRLTGVRATKIRSLLPWKIASAALKSAALLLAVVAIGIAMYVPFDVIQDVFTGKSSAVSTALSAITDPNKETDILKGTGLALCNETNVAGVQDFAACPAYVLDFNKVSTKDIGSRYFNVAEGLSETNQEAQIYTANMENVRVENGSLVLEARNSTEDGPAYTSARIDTKGKKDFQYGRLVVRAKMPAGVGTWPAIWMLPSNPKYVDQISAQESAHLADGEIDIAESIGREPNVVYSVTHSLAYDSNGIDRTFFNTVKVPGNDKNYHNYEVEWTPTSLTFKVDGVTFHTYQKQADATFRSWPYDQSYYLVMNLAMGGTWAGKDRKNFPVDGVDPGALPASLRVQSVAYYPYIGK